MKIKITEKGWAGYTGHLGNVAFEGGVSVGDVSDFDANRIGATMQIERLEGGNVGPAQTMLDTYAEVAPVQDAMARGGKGLTESKRKTGKPAPKAVAEDGKVYSRSELEAAAEADGIAGLRHVAGPMGIKGRSINELINEILQAQGNLEPVDTTPEGEGVQSVLTEETVKADVGEPSAEQKARLAKIER